MRNTIDVIGRISADLLPALVRAHGPMVEANRLVKWKAHMPFHVTVEAEKLHRVVHSQPRRIATSGGQAFPLPSFRIDAEDRGFALANHRRVCLRDMPAAFNAGA